MSEVTSPLPVPGAALPAAATVALTREQVVPSRARIKLPPWLEIAKPRLIPLLLATTLGAKMLQFWSIQ